MKDTTDAKKEKKSNEEVLELARSVKKIVVAKGKKVVEMDVKKDEPDDETILKHLLGPSGNLRAPTLRKGTVLLVGFNEEAYEEQLS